MCVRMLWQKKWIKAARLGEPWLAINRVLTVRGLRLCLLRRAREPQYEPISGSMLYVAASSLPFHTSGYTTRTHEVIRALRKAGIKVHALTRPGYPWDRKDRLCDPLSHMTLVEDVPYLHACAPSKFRPVFQYAVQAAPVIAKMAAERRVAVIHAASNHVNALPALLAAKRLGIPFHYEMRGLWELSRVSRMPEFEGSQGYRQGLQLEALVARNADRVFVISEQLRQYVRENWGLPAARTALLPNCVDPERMTPAAASRVRPGLIGYAGSLIGYEGLDVLIDAVAILAKQGMEVQVLVAGDGEARPRLEEQVRRLGLAERIEFLGVLPPEAARDMIGQCVLVCLPRRPFKVCELIPPIKLAEALVQGKPVIVPDLPVFRDELGDSQSGWFFRPADALSLADVIATALADRTELVAAGKRARAHAEAQRDWRLFVPEITESCKTKKR